MSQILGSLPAIIAAVVALNAVLSAVSILLNKIADVMHKPENGPVVQMIGKASALLSKLVDLVGMNIEHK